MITISSRMRNCNGVHQTRHPAENCLYGNSGIGEVPGSSGKREARGSWGFRQITCILMMTGSMGYGRVENMTAKLVEQTGEDTHLYILGGTNEELKKTLRDRYADTERHVLDFTTEAHLYMAAADILSTKTGRTDLYWKRWPRKLHWYTPADPRMRGDRNVAFSQTWDVCIRDTEDADTKRTKASAGSGGTGRNAEVSGKIRKALCCRRSL